MTEVSLVRHPRAEALEDPIEIVVAGQAVTWGSGAVRGNYQDWISRVQEAVREHPSRERLAEWFMRESGRLGIEVTFWIKHDSDLDNLLETIFNPIVDGACFEVPRQRRRRLDSRFQTALVYKIITSNEPRAVILLYPVVERRPKTTTV